MQRIGIGRTAEILEMGDGKVVKLFYENMSSEMAEKEYKINMYVSGKIKDIPKIYGKIDINNRTGLVFQKIDGIHLSRYMSRNITRIPNILKEYSELHCKINQIEVDTDNKDIGGINGIIESIKKQKCLNELEKETIISFLRITDKKQLCHGDYHPENVMIDRDNKLWIIDWITVSACNPNLDIARTYYLLRYGQSPEKRRFIIKIIEKSLKVYLGERYLKYRVSKKERNSFMCYFYIILILRRNDNIQEERNRLEKLIRKNSKRANDKMKKLLNSAFA
jgi:thiamine kinase-like enzyme